MAERGADEIRQEMVVERRRLDEAREGLRAELRSLVPVAVVGLAVVGVITARRQAGPPGSKPAEAAGLEPASAATR
jgi:hypothetical protein